MKRYRIYYWFGSIVTWWFTLAESEEEAIANFEREKGHAERIKRIEVER